MAKSKATLYVAGVTFLGFVCFALASVAIGIPYWGYYDSPSGGYDFDRGYFGPFKVCKQLAYNREKCGTDVSKFRLSSAIFISGMLALVAAVMLAVQIDESEKYGFRISRGISFYLQASLIVVVLLTIGLFIFALYDVLYSKRPNGDPTMMIDAASPSSATTINNPGFKEPRTKNGVSVTDASGKPYAGIRNGSGSVASMSTMVTSVSNGSSTVESLTRSPLRSSLKKPRPRGDNTLGIQNPGYSGSGNSPPMRRNGSIKKVRIQTHSTEV
ncbi:hypothetical protein GQX74_004652 [Glossina fuscipes]|nr:hypothetical protein GQX74_004652 [Glossina fuscipes]